MAAAVSSFLLSHYSLHHLRSELPIPITMSSPPQKPILDQLDELSKGVIDFHTTEPKIHQDLFQSVRLWLSPGLRALDELEMCNHRISWAPRDGGDCGV